ncbi:hypothetical protein GGF32_008891, partial [Allomyces javanicus]
PCNSQPNCQPETAVLVDEDVVEEEREVDPVEVAEFDLVELPEDEKEAENVCTVDPVEVDECEPEEIVGQKCAMDRVAAEDLPAIVLADSGVNMSDAYVLFDVAEHCCASPFVEETEKGVDAELKKQSKRWSMSMVMSGVKRAVVRFLPCRNHRVHVA